MLCRKLILSVGPCYFSFLKKTKLGSCRTNRDGLGFEDELASWTKEKNCTHSKI